MGGGTLKLCASAGPTAVTYMGHLVGRSRTHITAPYVPQWLVSGSVRRLYACFLHRGS
jgi:hypothetical protein